MSGCVPSSAVAIAQVRLAEGHPVPGPEIQLMAACGWITSTVNRMVVTSTVKGIMVMSTVRGILSQQHISSFCFLLVKGENIPCFSTLITMTERSGSLVPG